MKLQTTKLCVNCESLYEEIGPCPYCGSEVIVWLFRALGTTVEDYMEEMTDSAMGMKEDTAIRPRVHPSVSPTASADGTIMRGRSIAEFGAALNRLGRETVRVLTFGVIHAFK